MLKVGTGVIHADTVERIVVPTIHKPSKMIIKNSGNADVLVRFSKKEKYEAIPAGKQKEFDGAEFFFVKAKSGVQRLDMLYIG